MILQNFAGGEFRNNTILNNGANIQLLNACNALFEGNTILRGGMDVATAMSQYLMIE